MMSMHKVYRNNCIDIIITKGKDKDKLHDNPMYVEQNK